MTPSSTQYMLVFILLITHAIQLAAFYPLYYRTRYWSVSLSSWKGFTLRMNSRNGIPEKSRYEESSDAVKLIVGGLTTLTNLFNSDADGTKDNGGIANRGVTSFTPKQLYDEVVRDFDNGYLFSGDINYSIYDNDCVFTDPTISFRGLSTFKRNIQSLQPVLRALLSDKLVVLYSSQLSPESNRISAKWRMSGGVNLPWKPRIELTGETQFTYNGGGGEEGESPGLIRDYYEQWDISAADALLQLLSPAGINSARLDSSKTYSINVQKELSSLILTLQQMQPSTISTTGSPTTIFENEHFAKLRSHSKPLLGVTDSQQLFASGEWKCLYDSCSFLSSSPSHPQMTGRSMRVIPSSDSQRCSTGSRDDASAALVKSYSVLGYDVSVNVNMGISDDKQGDCFRLDVNQVEVHIYLFYFIYITIVQYQQRVLYNQPITHLLCLIRMLCHQSIVLYLLIHSPSLLSQCRLASVELEWPFYQTHPASLPGPLY
jgi:hypothetical protein